MKQPEFRIRKVSGRTTDWYHLEQRGWLWGWNQVAYVTEYECTYYSFPSLQACEIEIKKILRERNPDVIVREVNTDYPFTFSNIS